MAIPTTHLAKLPPGFATLRVFQLIGAITITGLTSFVIENASFVEEVVTLLSVSMSHYRVSRQLPSPNWIIQAIITTIILMWMICAENYAPGAYNYWAILAMEIFLFLTWIDAFGWMISGSLSDWSPMTVSLVNSDSCYNFENDCPGEQMVQAVVYAATVLSGAMV